MGKAPKIVDTARVAKTYAEVEPWSPTAEAPPYGIRADGRRMARDAPCAPCGRASNSKQDCGCKGVPKTVASTRPAHRAYAPAGRDVVSEKSRGPRVHGPIAAVPKSASPKSFLDGAIVRPISLSRYCQIEWTPLEYAALEQARECANAVESIARALDGIPCELIPADSHTRIEGGDTDWVRDWAREVEGEIVYDSIDDRMFDVIFWNALTQIESGFVGAHAEATEPLRWGAHSAIATMANYVRDDGGEGGLLGARAVLLAQLGLTEILIPHCDRKKKHGGDREDIRLFVPNFDRPFTECVDHDSRTPRYPAARLRPEYFARGPFYLPPAYLNRLLLGSDKPAPLPRPPTDPLRLEEIREAKTRALPALQRAYDRLIWMPAAEQLAVIQCNFQRDTDVVPFVATTESVMLVLRQIIAAKNALAETAIGPGTGSRIEYLFNRTDGSSVFPPEWGDWDLHLRTQRAYAWTIVFETPLSALPLPPSRRWIALTEEWLTLDGDPQRHAAVLAHEAFHFSNPDIRDGAPMHAPSVFNDAYNWERLVVGLSELHPLDFGPSGTRDCPAVPMDPRTYTCP